MYICTYQENNWRNDRILIWIKKKKKSNKNVFWIRGKIFRLVNIFCSVALDEDSLNIGMSGSWFERKVMIYVGCLEMSQRRIQWYINFIANWYNDDNGSDQSRPRLFCLSISGKTYCQTQLGLQWTMIFLNNPTLYKSFVLVSIDTGDENIASM